MIKEIKICPFCAEEIKKDAIKCKHCGKLLVDYERKIEENLVIGEITKVKLEKEVVKKAKGRVVRGGCIGISFVILGIVMFASDKPIMGIIFILCAFMIIPSNYQRYVYNLLDKRIGISKLTLKGNKKISPLMVVMIIFIIFLLTGLYVSTLAIPSDNLEKEINNVSTTTVDKTLTKKEEVFPVKTIKEQEIEDINSKISIAEGYLSLKEVYYESVDSDNFSFIEYKRLNDLYMSNGNYDLDKEVFFRQTLQKEINQLKSDILVYKNKLKALK